MAVATRVAVAARRMLRVASRTYSRPQPLALTQEFGDAVQRELGGEGGVVASTVTGPYTGRCYRDHSNEGENDQNRLRHSRIGSLELRLDLTTA